MNSRDSVLTDEPLVKIITELLKDRLSHHNCNIKNSEITAIRHPISKQIIKYQAITNSKKKQPSNFAKYPYEDFRKGQSMSQLAQGCSRSSTE